MRVSHDYSLYVIELGVEWMMFEELFLLWALVWSSLCLCFEECYLKTIPAWEDCNTGALHLHRWLTENYSAQIIHTEKNKKQQTLEISETRTEDHFGVSCMKCFFFLWHYGDRIQYAIKLCINFQKRSCVEPMPKSSNSRLNTSQRLFGFAMVATWSQGEMAARIHFWCRNGTTMESRDIFSIIYYWKLN